MNLTLEYESFQDFASKLWPHLSEEGMWVRSENPASVGELVDFDVMLADGFRLFHGTGQVIDVGASPGGGDGEEGMTLRFSQLDQPSRNLVRKVVSKHIGEGGKLFVLTTPGTKVEVVGDEESKGPEEGASLPGMGPEDLVAPFAGLESEAGWSGEAEPELSSFLRPSGKAVDLDDTLAQEDDLSRESLDEPAEATSSHEIEEASSTEASESPETTEADSFEAPTEVPTEVPTAAPVTEDWSLGSGDSPDLGTQFDPDLAETQRVEPAEFPEAGQVEMPLLERTESFEPMPSTVVPPQFPTYGSDAEEEAEGPSTDEFYPGESASSGRTWWPWVVVGGLAVGAGLYALVQLDTPLSGLFGRAAATEADAGAGAGDETVGGGPVLGADASLESAAADYDGVALAAAGDEGLEPMSGESGSETGAEMDVVAAAAPAANDPISSAAQEEAPAAQPMQGASTVSEAEEAPAAVEPSSGLEPLSLKRITWRDVEGDTVIRLALTGPLADDRFQIQRVSGGSPRQVLKLLGAEGGVPRGPVSIGSDHVQQLRFGVHNVDGMRQVHAVADLAEESVEFVGPVVIDDGAVELRFSRP